MKLDGKAAVVTGASSLGGGFEGIINLHVAGRLDMSRMVSARFDLDDGLGAVERAAEGCDGKVLILPHGEA
jgi:hypothetical protein